jgi:hypothetical protein
MSARPTSRPARRGRGRLLVIAALLAALTLWLPAAAPAQAKSCDNQLRLNGVQTTLTTDPATTNLLFGAGIIPMPVWPTPVGLTADAATYTFPITGGKVDATTLVGSIYHSGGIVLVEKTATGWKSLSLTEFTICIPAAPATPYLSAIVNGGSRATIADLDLSAATITRFVKHHRTFVSIADVGVALNDTAVGAVNATFGTGLTAPVALGSATVLARVGCSHSWSWHWSWMTW